MLRSVDVAYKKKCAQNEDPKIAECEHIEDLKYEVALHRKCGGD